MSTGDVSSGNYSITLSKVYRMVYFSFSVIFLCIKPSSTDVNTFSSSSLLFTPSSISIEEVSSGNSYITLSKVSQLVSFSYSVIYLCIKPSSSFSVVIYFLSSFSLFTHFPISAGIVSSGLSIVTLSKAS